MKVPLGRGYSIEATGPQIRLAMGAYNSDKSRGVNYSAGASLASVELSLENQTTGAVFPSAFPLEEEVRITPWVAKVLLQESR